jgi:23S rRNA (pseudouridine1915-N3)-methyltransferase
MPDILIAAIGKLKSGPELALYEHYAARLPWKIAVRELEIKKPLGAPQRMEQEAALLLKAAGDCEHLTAMDESGKEWSSAAFAAHLGRLRDGGVRRIAFAIGGADGLHESVLRKAQQSFSLGRVTWPHLLVRGLLAEQLYRAHTILNGHPYHRE